MPVGVNRKEGDTESTQASPSLASSRLQDHHRGAQTAEPKYEESMQNSAVKGTMTEMCTKYLQKASLGKEILSWKYNAVVD